MLQNWSNISVPAYGMELSEPIY